VKGETDTFQKPGSWGQELDVSLRTKDGEWCGGDTTMLYGLEGEN